MINDLRRNKQSLPGSLIIIVISVCTIPFALNLLGVDFSSTSTPLPEHHPLKIDDLFYRLSGAFTHTILEWTAFSIAIMTALFGFAHFKVAKETTIPVICIALFCAGSMDAFHTLAADRLIDSAADNRKLIPFTWAISRTFNALIIISGVSLFLLNPDLRKKTGLRFIVFISLLFAVIAFAIINYVANSHNLPITIYPKAFITRPWDVGPLILYCIAGLTVLRRFNQKYPSVFSQALLISMIPEIVVELHMAFGSKELFDNDFNIAHFIKIFAYLMPALGLMIDYIETYSTLEQTKDSLLEEKTKANTILENAINGIITINSTGFIQSINLQAEHIFGYQEDEVLNKNINMLMATSDHNKQDSNWRQYITADEKNITGIDRETSGRRKNGAIFSLELEIAKVKLLNETIYTAFVRDISQRKSLENELKRREQLFSTFVNATPVMMWMLDASNKPIMFNETWLSFNGHSLEQELASNWDNKNIHSNDRIRVMKEYTEALANHWDFDHEYRLKHHNGKYHWFREIGVPYNINNTYQGFIGICLDITERKVSEQQLTHYTKDLERSNAELEQFAYIASHDLQEPLRMVSSYTQLLARRYQDKLDDDANEFIAFAVDGANRMQTLIQDLLAYSRVGKRKQTLKSIELEQILQSVLTGLKISIEESGATINQPDVLPQIFADQSQLQQLFQNLISNAIKYRNEQHPCIIDINLTKNNNMWQFSIQDNGIGIETDFFERIFVIFQRLHGKERYSGTGIGLAVCKRIVEGHGGEIWLDSKFGKGSTFYFTLPVEIN